MQHLYMVEWTRLECSDLAASPACVCIGSADVDGAAPGASALLAGSRASAVVLVSACTQAGQRATLPLVSLESALGMLQVGSASAAPRPVWLLTASVPLTRVSYAVRPEHAGVWGGRVRRAVKVASRRDHYPIRSPNLAKITKPETQR